MGVPRLSEAEEEKRADIVGEIHHSRLYEDVALTRVAETVASICGVEQAYVSIMEDETQYVVGHVGMETDEFDRDQSFSAYTVAENEVVVVEDATEDARFAESKYVVGVPGIRFYVGLPIVVGGVPIGTICAIDTVPREIDMNERGELFGAVNVVEAHFRVAYQHGLSSLEYAVSQKVTAARASATGARFVGEMDAACVERVHEVEGDLSECIGLLKIEESDAKSRLGYVETDVEE